MFIEKFGIFILFLGPLVFFHELGHFFFARLFGVRVEVFSIGFGPKLFKFKKGDTEYAVSLIPLGGYVKMFGDDPLNKDAVPEEERQFSFTHKGKWARFWIVMGGPLANFIMAFCIFFSLFLIGEKIPEIRLGGVPSTSNIYEWGFRSGDKLRKVNGNEIYNPSDIVSEGKDIINTITVVRVGQEKVLKISQSGEVFFNAFIKYPPLLRKPILVDRLGNIFAISRHADKVDWAISLDELSSVVTEKNFYLYEMDKKLLLDKSKAKASDKFTKEIELTSGPEFFKGLRAKGYRGIDLSVKSVNMKSAADKAGIRSGDILISLNDKKVQSFDELRKSLQLTKSKEVTVKVYRNGEAKVFDLVPEIKKQGQREVKLIGVYSAGEYQGLSFVETKSLGIVGSVTQGLVRTWETIVKTLSSFKKLIVGDVSFKSIGGPLAIGKVAADSFHTSLSYFFQLMALISVNLGVINLFPIPVLDGGHIMFIFLEIINRGPVSRRRMEIAQQLGLSLLLMLMVGAIFNDFSRFF